VLQGVPILETVGQTGIAGNMVQSLAVLRELAVVQLMKRRIEQLSDAGSFDVLHAHSPALCGLAALGASRSRQIPFVYEIRSFGKIPQWFRGRQALLARYLLGRGLETFVARRANAVIGISSAILKDLEARPVSSPKLFHVPNGVDTRDLYRESAITGSSHRTRRRRRAHHRLSWDTFSVGGIRGWSVPLGALPQRNEV